MVLLPPSTATNESLRIAQALESLHPSPPLHITAPADLAHTQQVIDTLLTKCMGPLIPEWMPRVPAELLREESQGYFRETREKRVGMPLERLAEEKGGEGCWQGAKEGWEACGRWVGEGREKGGPFMKGKEPSFADFAIVATLHFLRILDEKRLFDRAVSFDPALKEVYEASTQWLEREDH